jgi:hypothetical protein
MSTLRFEGMKKLLRHWFISHLLYPRFFPLTSRHSKASSSSYTQNSSSTTITNGRKFFSLLPNERKMPVEIFFFVFYSSLSSHSLTLVLCSAMCINVAIGVHNSEKKGKMCELLSFLGTFSLTLRAKSWLLATPKKEWKRKKSTRICTRVMKWVSEMKRTSQLPFSQFQKVNLTCTISIFIGNSFRKKKKGFSEDGWHEIMKKFFPPRERLFPKSI